MANSILVTGCAGFIGSHLTDRLLTDGHHVIGLDNFNDYYDPKIKEGNLKFAKSFRNFKIYKLDITDLEGLKKLFKKEEPALIIHLAARAGVRPSIINPKLYAHTNVLGTINLAKLAADFKIKNFIFGSSSSVYGESKKIPFCENDLCQNIISPYASSKIAAESIIASFHKNHGLKSTILRFFTVYGPRGRPDMAPAIFTRAIIKGNEIVQFGDGSSIRDYTYIDDITNGILQTIRKDLKFEIINLGSNNPVTLNKFIKTLEKLTGKKAMIKKLPKQEGDVEKTWANVVKAKKLLRWKPKVKLEKGLIKYLKWLREI